MSLDVYYFTEMPYHHIDDDLAEQWPSLRLTSVSYTHLTLPTILLV